jgi:protein SCO1/2
MRRLAVGALAVAILGSACSSIPDEPAGIVRDPAPEVGTTSLPDVSAGGAAFPFAAAPGQVLVVYFGYTSCPDVCPTTMADLRRALEELGGQADDVDVAMATVDPERDTDEVLTAYVRSFVPGGYPLRTTDDGELRTAAEAFGADYRVETSPAGDVEVEHTGFLYAVDDQGMLRLTWPFGTQWQAIEGDLRWLMERGMDR